MRIRQIALICSLFMNNVICKQNAMFCEESFRKNGTLYVHLIYKYFDRFLQLVGPRVISSESLPNKQSPGSFSRHNKSAIYDWMKHSEKKSSDVQKNYLSYDEANNKQLGKEDTQRSNLANI